MNRLQKKCFIFSVSLHGLLLGVFLFGSAFFVSEEKPDNTRVLHMISGKLVDDALSSGGNPEAQPVTQ
ncbi:MAG TPA: cell envelope integrity protein TolA, partial [Verrucomicrobiae bacterium]|nr:cell envelope integrity protein TolA [Verrucomicrobiae bacterium]